MNVEERAKKIRLLVLDVDGVLTDGGLYYDGSGQVSKRFHVQDGLGIRLAQRAGIEVAIITGLDSVAVATRAKDLRISQYYAGIKDKIPVLKKICAELKIGLEQTAYVGDDWVDAGVMYMVGLSVAVANAGEKIKSVACMQTKKKGGNGAVREVIEFILQSKGQLDEIWQSFVQVGENLCVK